MYVITSINANNAAKNYLSYIKEERKLDIGHLQMRDIVIQVQFIDVWLQMWKLRDVYKCAFMCIYVCI